jgi:hypothetical protein
MTRPLPSRQDLFLIEQNLFEAARPAMKKVRPDKWHQDKWSPIAASRRNSSQAMAISVFGTLDNMLEPCRTAVFDALAESIGLSAGGPWCVDFEYDVPYSVLGEPRPSQLDVRWKGRRALIAVESKFTESHGGCCSQTRRPRRRGEATPVPDVSSPCNGRYELQGASAQRTAYRCALTSKGIKYWDHIPEVLGYSPSDDHDPCPFRGSNFQWMRNVVAAHAEASPESLRAGFVLAYADSQNSRPLPTQAYIESEAWAAFRASSGNGPVTVRALSHRAILDIASDAAGAEVEVIKHLIAWADDRIAEVW